MGAATSDPDRPEGADGVSGWTLTDDCYAAVRRTRTASAPRSPGASPEPPDEPQPDFGPERPAVQHSGEESVALGLHLAELPA